MGRPIKKSKMAGAISGKAGQIAVTAYRPFGGSKVDSTDAYIVSQRASKLFKIALDDSTTSVYCMKAVAPGSLANDNASGYGEFCVQLILNDSTVAYVEKFYNNTVHYVTAGGATGNAKYTLGAEGDDEGNAGAGSVSVDVISDK